MFDFEVKFHIHGLFDTSLHNHSQTPTGSFCILGHPNDRSTSLSTAEDAVPLLVSQTIDPKLISSLRQLKKTQHLFCPEADLAQGAQNKGSLCDPSVQELRPACGVSRKILLRQAEKLSSKDEAQVCPEEQVLPCKGDEQCWQDGGAFRLQQLVGSNEESPEPLGATRACRGPGPKLFASVKGASFFKRL